jgi:hypothetical protein
VLIGWVGDDAAYIADQINTVRTSGPKLVNGEAVGTRYPTKRSEHGRN